MHQLTRDSQRSIRTSYFIPAPWTVPIYEEGNLLATGLVGSVIQLHFIIEIKAFLKGLAAASGGAVAWQHIVGRVDWNVITPYIAGLVR